MNSQGINNIVQQLWGLVCPDSITEHPDGHIDIATQDFGNITLYPEKRKIQFEERCFDMAKETYEMIQKKPTKHKHTGRRALAFCMVGVLTVLGIMGIQSVKNNTQNASGKPKTVKENITTYKRVCDSINLAKHNAKIINQK